MAGSKGIRRVVQLFLNKESAKTVEREVKQALDKGTDPKKAKQNLRTIESGFDRIRKLALRLGAAIAGALAVRRIVQFGKEAVRVAAEASEIWGRLETAVNNTGKNFDDLKPSIDAIARSMQDATTVGDEAFAGVLTELITITNNYEASLYNVQTVADLAAAKQIDLRTAAQLVGRAMIGETSTLKRYGIVVEEGADAVEVLRERFRGFAENEAKTFGGRLRQLTNEWDDFKQAVGEALIAAGDGQGILETLIGVVKTLTEWVNSNKETFTALGDVVKGLKTPLLGLIELYARLTQGASMLAKAQNVVLSLWPGGVFDRLVERNEARIEAMDQWARSVLDLVERLKTGAESAVTLPPPPIAKARVPGATGAGAGGAGTVEAPDYTKIPGRPGFGIPLSRAQAMLSGTFARTPFGDPSKTMFSGFVSGFETSRAIFGFEAQTQLEDLRKQIEELPAVASEASADIQAAMVTAAYTITDAFAAGFEIMVRDMSSLPEAAKEIGKGVVRGLSQGMAQYHMSQGIGKLAEGTWPPNPLALASAAKHFLAAAAFKALGALVGSGSRGGAGAAGSSTGGATRPTGVERRGPEVHIYLDPFNPNSPLHQRQIKLANDLATERFGEQVPVTVHTRGGA